MFVARRKALRGSDQANQSFDALLLNTWELAVAFRSHVKRIPTAIIIDAVPATIDAAVRRRKGRGLKRAIAHWVHQRSFARVVPYVDYFLVKSSECAESLRHDFGISAERCFITMAPLDLNVWKPRPARRGRREKPVRLLFVGNDFSRKGGDWLLGLYKKHLSTYCVLTIVSTDPRVAEMPENCEGVRFIPGLPREELVRVFQDSDLFVFPTRQDYTPEVVAEALATGLPCLMGEVDGARDLIRDGENGYVLAPDASPELWASHIRRLSDNPEELNRMSVAARGFAEQALSLDRFNSTISFVMECLGASAG
jgi:glycosyltransferase involved in cell wall biosynthesis